MWYELLAQNERFVGEVLYEEGADDPPKYNEIVGRPKDGEVVFVDGFYYMWQPKCHAFILAVGQNRPNFTGKTLTQTRNKRKGESKQCL